MTPINAHNYYYFFEEGNPNIIHSISVKTVECDF